MHCTFRYTQTSAACGRGRQPCIGWRPACGGGAGRGSHGGCGSSRPQHAGAHGDDQVPGKQCGGISCRFRCRHGGWPLHQAVPLVRGRGERANGGCGELRRAAPHPCKVVQAPLHCRCAGSGASPSTTCASLRREPSRCARLPPSCAPGSPGSSCGGQGSHQSRHGIPSTACTFLVPRF